MSTTALITIDESITAGGVFDIAPRLREFSRSGRTALSAA